MSILNVDKIQPIGGGSTITVDATDIQASTGTIRASTFSGDVSATGIGVTSLNVAGVTTFANNVFLGDDDRILFGDGGLSDAHVRYDGSHLQFGVASGQFRVSADTANFVNYAGTQTLATINSTSVTIPTKLGINGAAPQTPLDVVANSSSYAINVRGRSSDNVGEIRFTSNNYGSLYGQIVTGPTYLNFNTGGVERLQLDGSETTFNSPGADTDFRIRTPAQGHIFYVDAGNDQVCIKTSTAQSGAVLTVNGRTHINTQVTLGSNSTLDAGAQATIYKPATNTLAFATAGANERLRITSGGQVRIGNENNLALWGQTNRLQVAGTDWNTSGVTIACMSNSGSANLVMGNSRASTPGGSGGALVQDSRLAYISFVGDDGTDMNTVGAAIVAELDSNASSNSMPARLRFYTGGNQSSNEALRITSAGKVGINESSPDQALHVKGTSGDTVPARFESTGAQSRIGFKASGTSNSYNVACGAEAEHFIVYTSNEEKLRITSTGYREIRNYHYGPFAFTNDTWKSTITVSDPGDHKHTTIKFILTIIDGTYRQGFWQGEFVIWSSNAVGGPGVSHIYKKIWDNEGSSNWSGGSVSYQMSGGAFQFKADNGHDDANGNAYIHILDVIGDIDGSTVATISA